jgi:hypothetical protein
MFSEQIKGAIPLLTELFQDIQDEDSNVQIAALKSCADIAKIQIGQNLNNQSASLPTPLFFLAVFQESIKNVVPAILLMFHSTSHWRIKIGVLETLSTFAETG